MQKITIALLSLMSITSYSQQINYDKIKIDTTFIKLDSGKALISNFYNFSLIGKDTVRVIMLVCDTSTRLSTEALPRPIRPQPEWVQGYSVLDKYCCIESNTSDLAISQRKPHFIHKEYLDENKKPFSESIIVWLSKELLKP